MKRRLSIFIVAGSLALASLPAGSARRPRYGGTLRVEIGETIHSLDPAVPATDPAATSAKNQIDALLYASRNADGTFSGLAGSGAFRVTRWEAGKHATLSANNDYPGGRPFLDSIEIQMGRAAKDRLLDLELNRTDLAEIPPEEARRAAERGVRVSTSKPDELIALVFIGGRPVAESALVREALSDAIDRSSIVDFILQREGEPAGGLLPQWSSGTAFLFSIIPALSGAKEQWAGIGGSPKIVLGYDAADGLAQTVAERIAVNARETGISLTLSPISNSASSTGKADARLVRIGLPSPRPREALLGIIREAGPMAGVDAAPLPDPASLEQIYERERTVVGDHRIVPLAWIPHVYGLSSRVRDWRPPLAGETWTLADVWLDTTIEMR
ncbi:MAG: ABC transporter substrate-binding protein [Candidatus Acidiferrales bacterium]|jgi:peptide/nickel transport system substrate-binding protein